MHPSIWALIESVKYEEVKVATLVEADSRGENVSRRVRKEYVAVSKRLKKLCIDRANGLKTIPELLRGVGRSVGYLKRSQDYGQDMEADLLEDEVILPAEPEVDDVQDELPGQDELPDAARCAVCLGERIEPHVFIPCGHPFCSNCKEVIMGQLNPRCPTCRADVVNAIRMFNV